jgi:transposase
MAPQLAIRGGIRQLTHARRKFFDLARIKKAPIAIEAIKRIDALFAIGEINGLSPEQRLTARAEKGRPLLTGLET